MKRIETWLTGSKFAKVKFILFRGKENYYECSDVALLSEKVGKKDATVVLVQCECDFEIELIKGIGQLLYFRFNSFVG